MLLISTLLLFLQLEDHTFFHKADRFFEKNVSETGMVDYQSIKRNPEALNQLVKEIAELDLSNRRVTPEFLKAFYVNAYNILNIKAIVDHYPIRGPLAIDGFFDQINYRVMGESMTLDSLEKEVLFAQFSDPRLHLLLVCGAKSCPPLAAYAYTPEKFNLQIAERTQKIMNLDQFIRVKGNTVEVTKIFEWYRSDFEDAERSLINFINTYRETPIDQDVKIIYDEYDWSLNEQ